MPGEPWKQVAPYTRSPWGLARTPGALQPRRPGANLGMDLSAAEREIRVLQEAKEKVTHTSQGEGRSHMLSDHSVSFLYSLWLLI